MSFKRRLSHLAIRTVQDMGWTGTKNGELLRRAEVEFDVLVTADQQSALPAESFRSNTRDHRPSDQPSSHYGQSAAGD